MDACRSLPSKVLGVFIQFHRGLLQGYYIQGGFPLSIPNCAGAVLNPWWGQWRWRTHVASLGHVRDDTPVPPAGE